MADTIQINEKTWRFEDDGVRFFLLCGTEKAALVDSGMNTPNAKEMAEKWFCISSPMPDFCMRNEGMSYDKSAFGN